MSSIIKKNIVLLIQFITILQLNGAVRYSDVDNVCLASSSRGSVKSALNRRDPEYHLLDGFLNFYVEEDLR